MIESNNLPLLSPKQIQFLKESTKRWNLAHGAVSTGKTVCTLHRFMQACYECPDSQIFIVGHSCDTSYQNVIRLLLEAEEFSIFRKFCTWFSGKRQLKFYDKTIQILGAKDEGALAKFRGLTASLMYCDEMTLYPENIIDMIDTRLRRPHSMGFAAMNPTHPTHKCKQWIDWAIEGNENYYQLHFALDDNPFIDESYKERIRNSSAGIFHKRNVLGLWCLAEGAIFDFFDRKIHVVHKPPRAADYWIAGIDYGASNAFACVLIGISTGQYTHTGKCMWVEKEFYWDYKVKQRQLTNDEFADYVKEFIEPYGVRNIYIDPSALAFKLELQKRGMHITEANNDVYNGIQMMTTEMAKGNLFVCKDCPNLIKEIENYVWDQKKAIQGDDAPVKKGDHAVDALRYCLASHKVTALNNYQHNPQQYMRNRFGF